MKFDFDNFRTQTVDSFNGMIDINVKTWKLKKD